MPNMKTEYLPSMDQGRLSISIELPVGTGENVTGQLAKELHDKYKAEIPEIKMLNFSYGVADEENAFASMNNNGTHIISMNADLGRKTERNRSTQQIAEYIREDLKANPIIKKYNVGTGMGMGGIHDDIFFRNAGCRRDCFNSLLGKSGICCDVIQCVYQIGIVAFLQRNTGCIQSFSLCIQCTGVAV